MTKAAVEKRRESENNGQKRGEKVRNLVQSV